MILKVYSVAFVLLALAAAAVQYNDPDGSIWIATYGAAAIVGVLSIAGRLPRAFALAYAVVVLAWAGWLGARLAGAHSFFADPEVQMLGLSEETREMLGLLIAGVSAVVLGVASPRGRPKAARA